MNQQSCKYFEEYFVSRCEIFLYRIVHKVCKVRIILRYTPYGINDYQPKMKILINVRTITSDGIVG